MSKSLTFTVCGPPRYSEIRINISQAFNGVGTVIAPVLGSYVFFNNLDDEEALANVQWVYLSIAVFVLILACLFYISKIPEITDAGMSTPKTYKDSTNTSQTWHSKPKRLTQRPTRNRSSSNTSSSMHPLLNSAIQALRSPLRVSSSTTPSSCAPTRPNP